MHSKPNLEPCPCPFRVWTSPERPFVTFMSAVRVWKAQIVHSGNNRISWIFDVEFQNLQFSDMWEATKRSFANIGCVGYAKKATLVNFYTNMTWLKCRNVISTQDSVSLLFEQKILCVKSVKTFLRFRDKSDKSVKFKLKHSAWKSLQNVWKKTREMTRVWDFTIFLGKQWKWVATKFLKNSRNHNSTNFC